MPKEIKECSRFETRPKASRPLLSMAQRVLSGVFSELIAGLQVFAICLLMECPAHIMASVRLSKLYKSQLSPIGTPKALTL